MEKSKKGKMVLLEREQECIALLSDPYAVGGKLKHRDKLKASVAGHEPREISITI